MEYRLRFRNLQVRMDWVTRWRPLWDWTLRAQSGEVRSSVASVFPALNGWAEPARGIDWIGGAEA
jgi:hypothetical protein